jgi:hypothetical protein
VITYRFAEVLIESPSKEPTDIIAAMINKSIFCGSQTEQEYMEDLATRIKNYADVEISTESPQQFVDGLILNGFLIRDDVGAE